MSNEAPTCRPQAEIERAHNLIWHILAGPGREIFHETDLILMAATLSALCWVLGHDGNPVLQQNLDGAKEKLRAEGIPVNEGEAPPHPSFEAWVRQRVKSHMVN